MVAEEVSSGSEVAAQNEERSGSSESSAREKESLSAESIESESIEPSEQKPELNNFLRIMMSSSKKGSAKDESSEVEVEIFDPSQESIPSEEPGDEEMPKPSEPEDI